MLFLQLFFTLLICLERQAVAVESDYLCQAAVIQECSDESQGLLKALGSGNEHLLMEECNSLQATIDCLSVPCCYGNLLQGFRYLVLSSATALQKTSPACYKLDIKLLRRYVKGFSIPCQDEAIKDTCDRRCKCKDGNLINCFRKRKELTKMSLEERTRFIKAFKRASSDPRYRSEYRKLTNLYSEIPIDVLHQPEIFLPWHRGYLLELENLLRQIDCRITIPYWNWSKDAAHWARGSKLEDVWNPGAHGLGGNGVSPDKCVMDGPFKKGEFFLPRDAGGGCLKRDFNQSCNLPNAEDVQNIEKQTNFTVFEGIIREVFNLNFHECFGESMHSSFTAAHTPEFWLHLGFIDKLWADWQNKQAVGKKLGHYQSVMFKMPGFERFPWEYMIMDSLPDNVRVLYEE